MIALDTSAIVAVAIEESEASDFDRLTAVHGGLVGTRTLPGAHLVPARHEPEAADEFLAGPIEHPSIPPVSFELATFRLAISAFDRFGNDRGQPAKLNFGHCMSYAVAQFHDVLLLFKGDDFRRTDIRPAA